MQPSMRPRDGLRRAAASQIAAVFVASAVLVAALVGTTVAGALAAAPALASVSQTHPHHKAPARHHASSPSPAATHQGWVKYYIVQPPKDGNKEFLYEIAVKTLGNGSLAKEIFTLNKGRLQPGGGRLELPTVILPGWILVLPSSARGPGVHYGPLPVVTPPASSSASTSPSAAPSGHVSQRVSQPVTGSGASPSGKKTMELAIGGAILVALLLALTLLFLRRRRAAKPTRGPGGPPKRPAGPGSRRPRRGAATPGASRPDADAQPALPGTAVPAGSAVSAGTAVSAGPAVPAGTLLAGPADGPVAADGTGAAGYGWPETAASDAPSYPSWLGVPEGNFPDPANAPAFDTRAFDAPAAAAPTAGAPQFETPQFEAPQFETPPFAGQPFDASQAGAPVNGAPVNGSSGAWPADAGATGASGPSGASAAGSVPAPRDPAAPAPNGVAPGGQPGADEDMPWPDFLNPAAPVIQPGPADQASSAPPAAPLPAAPLPAVPPTAVPPTAVPPAAVPPAAAPAAGPDASGPPSASIPPSAGPGAADHADWSPDELADVAASAALNHPAAVTGDAGPAAGSGAATGGRPDGDPESEPLPEPAFSPVALRILGAQRSTAQIAEKADMPEQRHQVALGDDRIEVALTEAPASREEGKSRSGHTWLTATPYLVWTPLPYDIPEDGAAFACVGAGDEGCLFIDLAASPGAIGIGGRRAAATRLAESIAHQLSLAAASGRPVVVILVGDVLPEPFPSGVAWVETLSDLASATVPEGASDATEIIFCELRSNEDAFALARYVGSAQRRVVPVVLANLPSAPWSFTALPSLRPAEALHPAVS